MFALPVRDHRAGGRIPYHRRFLMRGPVVRTRCRARRS